MKWSKIARKNQRLPKGNWKYWLILAGRGFGKTRSASENLCDQILKYNGYFRVGVIGLSIYHIKNVLIEGISGIVSALKSRKIDYEYHKTSLSIVGNNFKINFYPSKSINYMRGMEFHWIWIDELCNMPSFYQIFLQSSMCLRLKNSKMIITSTPQSSDDLERIKNYNNMVITTGSSFQNHKLPRDFLRQMSNKLGEKQYQKEIMSKYDSPYLWTKKDIVYKFDKPMERYILGIDIAVNRGTTGIVLVGIKNKKYYVIQAIEAKKNHWINWVKQLVNQFFPIRIIYESNQGGKLLLEILNYNNIKCLIRGIFVQKSKINRHYQVYLMYVSKLVYHICQLPVLEKAMCSGTNLDLMDALFLCLVA